MAVDHQDTNIRYVHHCQSENMMSSSIAAEAVWYIAQTLASQARLIEAAAPSSGAFLQAIPMSSVGTRLDNKSMCIAVSLRLCMSE